MSDQIDPIDPMHPHHVDYQRGRAAGKPKRQINAVGVVARIVIVMIVVIGVALWLILALSGCSAQPTAKADPKASSATAPTSDPGESAADDAGASSDDDTNDIQPFGGTVTWVDNLSVSVSQPSPYKASEYAAGATKGQKQVVFEIVLTNNTGKMFDPAIMLSATSGGEEASSIFDMDESGNGTGMTPTAKLLPGKTIKWKAAFSVADPKDITVQVTPDYEHNDAIFTNNK